MTNKNKAVWDWIKTYNGVDKLFFNFGEIGDNSSTIVPVPSDAVIKTDICGNKVRNYIFGVSVYKTLDSIIPFGVDNLNAFGEVGEFMQWVDEQNRKANFPDFGEMCVIDEVKCIENNPTTSKAGEIAKYFFQVKITYTETEE